MAKNLKKWGMWGFLGEVHAKKSGLYQVPNWSYGQKSKKKGVTWGKLGGEGELGALYFPGEGPRENPRSLSNPKVAKFESGKKSTDRPTDGGTYTIR